ncbi:hypothetical protein GXM_01614 [Nostoc sphaeroides CCNUC1]|uniref:Uncharacterized protein n=1 Tax=Nostoc sphaeroides CCNUC1 TaxID=2653204 RepID=A0A5P8VUY2_9NOSO|nr:hypothetical protein GXM_01614 [Nostoc sphaeroides CCNUC1]
MVVWFYQVLALVVIRTPCLVYLKLLAWILSKQNLGVRS